MRSQTAVAIAALSVFPVMLLLPGSGLSQIVLDRTTATQIDGNTIVPRGFGTVSGQNLYHSFEQFNVPPGGVVFGKGTSAIDGAGILNLFTRITGNTPSAILGTIQSRSAFPNANFWLVNPNGILFGTNARLDIGGSFFATTGTGIGFRDGQILQVARSLTFPSGDPATLRFGISQPTPILALDGALVNRGSINLVGGTIISTSTITASNIGLLAVPGHSIVELRSPDSVLGFAIAANVIGTEWQGSLVTIPQLAKLLTGQALEATQTILGADGSLRFAPSTDSLQVGEVRVRPGDLVTTGNLDAIRGMVVLAAVGSVLSPTLSGDRQTILLDPPPSPSPPTGLVSTPSPTPSPSPGSGTSPSPTTSLTPSPGPGAFPSPEVGSAPATGTGTSPNPISGASPTGTGTSPSPPPGTTSVTAVGASPSPTSGSSPANPSSGNCQPSGQNCASPTASSALPSSALPSTTQFALGSVLSANSQAIVPVPSLLVENPESIANQLGAAGSLQQLSGGMAPVSNPAASGLPLVQPNSFPLPGQNGQTGQVGQAGQVGQPAQLGQGQPKPGASLPSQAIANLPQQIPISAFSIQAGSMLSQGLLPPAFALLERGAKSQLEAFAGRNLQSFARELSMNDAQVTISKLSSLTDSNSAVIYPIILEDRLDLLVIPSNGKPIRRSVPAAAKRFIEPTIAQFLDNLRDPGFQDYKQQANQLYELVIRPIEAELQANKIQTLVFVMDGALRVAPPAAWHDGKQFLIEKYAIAIVPSLQMTNLQQSDRANNRILAMGLSEAVQGFAALPAVAVEVNTISQRLFGGNGFLNQPFTIANLQRQRQQQKPSIIHLATHAQFLSDRASGSFIQFWNERLPLSNIPQLRFDDPAVEMLTLSACQTAVGTNLGISGLAVESGAKSVLASLWTVSDAGTAPLMISFYSNLRTAPSKAIALQQAQLALLKGKVSVRNRQITGIPDLPAIPLPHHDIGVDISHPFYWSSFILVGNWL